MNKGMLTIEESRYDKKAAEGGEYVKQDNRMRLLLNYHVGFQSPKHVCWLPLDHPIEVNRRL
jgi:hypothetical protein